MNEKPTKIQLLLIRDAITKATTQALLTLGDSWKDLSFFNGHELTEHEKQQQIQLQDKAA